MKNKEGAAAIENSKATRFKKGDVPYNKGKKQVDFMSAAAIENTVATRFKKGSIPFNYRPMGSERITTDGYVEVKTREGLRSWDMKHRVVWEAANGKLAPGLIVTFKDGNKQNCALENLYLISRKENMRNNTIHNYPEDLKELIMIKAQIKKRIKKTKKKWEQKQQPKI